MSWLDIIILIILIISALVGLKVGIIKAVLSIIGVVVGVVLAGRFYGAFAEHLTFIPHAGLAKIVAFAIILVVVMIAAAIAAALIKWAISAVLMGWVNRLGGAVFGVLLGAIFCGALLTIWVKFVGIADPVQGSALAALLVDNFPMVLALLPDDFNSVRSFFQ